MSENILFPGQKNPAVQAGFFYGGDCQGKSFELILGGLSQDRMPLVCRFSGEYLSKLTSIRLRINNIAPAH